MIRQETWMDIKTLKAQGYSQRAVARVLGVHRDTVRRVWDETTPQKYEREARPTKLDLYLEHLKARLGATPELRGVRLFREIRERGYSGGYEAVKVFCRAWRRDWRARQGTVRFETSPGVQAQADWGESREVGFADGSQVTRYFFSLVLAFSRLRFVVYLPSVAQHWLLWAHLRAFAFFGGVPQTILYDNPKSLVLRPRPALIWHERLLAFASHYGFVPQACWPARAQTKGKVENAIGYHRRDFLLGLDPSPQDDAELNRRALEWCEQVAGRVCATTGVTPRERFEEERAYLRPLPGLDFDCRPMETRRVLREAMVAYAGNRYSVPARHVGQLVTVKEGFDATLRFYADTEEVAVHPCLVGRGQRSVLPEHHAPLWEAVKQLGKNRVRAAEHLEQEAAAASVSLWRPSLVAVERRPLSLYQDLLEGRC
jgi:transposase